MWRTVDVFLLSQSAGRVMRTIRSMWFINLHVALAQVLLVTCLKEQMPTTLSTWPQGGTAHLSCCWGESLCVCVCWRLSQKEWSEIKGPHSHACYKTFSVCIFLSSQRTRRPAFLFKIVFPIHHFLPWCRFQYLTSGYQPMQSTYPIPVLQFPQIQHAH